MVGFSSKKIVYKQSKDQDFSSCWDVSLDFVGKAGYNRCITTVIDSWNRTWDVGKAQRKIMGYVNVNSKSFVIECKFDVFEVIFLILGETKVCGM